MLEYVYEISPVFDHLSISIKKMAQTMNVPIIKDDTLLYLINLIYLYKPEKILELGSGLGYSTYTFAKFSSENTKITSVDISKETIMRCKDILSISKNFKKINWVNDEALNFLKNNRLNYDLYFIDAMKREYPLYFDTIKKNAEGKFIIVMDNLYMDGKVFDKNDKKGSLMNFFNRRLFLENRGRFIFLPIGDGLGIYNNF